METTKTESTWEFESNECDCIGWQGRPKWCIYDNLFESFFFCPYCGEEFNTSKSGYGDIEVVELQTELDNK